MELLKKSWNCRFLQSYIPVEQRSADGRRRPSPHVSSLDSRSGGDSQNQQGHIIGTAALEGHVYQKAAGIGGSVRSHDAGDIWLADHAPEAVGTKHQRIAFIQGDGVIGAIGDDVFARAEGRGENMALRVRLGVFGADDAAFNEPAHVGMIPGETGDGFGTHEVQAAVANMGKAKFAADDGKGSAGSSHAVKFRMFLGIALDVLMRHREGFDQSVLRIAVEGAVVDVAHSIDSEAAGFLSAFVTTHAVGDDGEAAFAEKFFVRVGFPVEVGVFIVGALTSDVGQARNLDSGFCVTTVNRHS